MIRNSHIRVSRVRSFSECHRYAVASQSIPWDGRLHVATWIGNSVHARLLGLKNDPIPDDLKFDKKTTTAERAEESVDKILAAITQWEDRYKPTIKTREWGVEQIVGSTKITGTIDMLCSIEDRTVIVDLKTGQSAPAVWIQTSLYAWLAEHHEKGKHGVQVDTVAFLHVPRVGPRTEQRWSYEERSYADFSDDVRQWLYTLDSLCQADYCELAASPGLHCQRCPVQDCAVRAHPAKE